MKKQARQVNSMILLIYNPSAGQKTFVNKLDFVIQEFQKTGEFLLLHRMDSAERFLNFFEKLSPQQFSKVLVAGGDGTLNLVIGAMRRKNWEVPIGIYPVGTANDFASYFSLPKDIKKMTQILQKNKSVRADVGIVNGKHFVNVLSMGYLVEVSETTDAKAKNKLGLWAYYLKGLEEVMNLKSTLIKIKGRAIELEEEIYLMLVLNGKSAGGFTHMLEDASVEDGLLDVLLFKKCPMIEVLSLFIQLVNGEHINSPYVIYFKTDYLYIQTQNEMKADIDGEMSLSCPLQVGIEKGAISVLVP